MNRWIIGGGMTGLAAGMASGFEVLERSDQPGGLCATRKRAGYRFEPGGGHWIFAGDPVVSRLLTGASKIRSYRRRSAVLFLGSSDDTAQLRNLIVPFPIQDNLFALPEEIRSAALTEILADHRGAPVETMADWLHQRFGDTLCRIFFDPFHSRYTAGGYRQAAPQDLYKTPIDRNQVRSGALRGNIDSGYNATFAYPVLGLDTVSRWLAQRCAIRYNTEVARIDASGRRLEFGDGRTLPYDEVISTIPLNRLVEMLGLGGLVGSPDPWTSVLVLNLGVTLPNTLLARHGYHWLYVPDSRSGFHRIGYYSNVDALFLPADRRADPGAGALYVETAFPGGRRLTADDTRVAVNEIVTEIRECALIDGVEVVDPTWVDVAYTWRKPGSDWASRAISACQACGLRPAGRYGRWRFQGIAASLKEGLNLGMEWRQI
jgi:protoporphyrinogen oxidase